MSENNISKKEKMKKFFMYLTIGLLSFCALIGIAMIFVGVDTTMMNMICTLLIFYGVVLISTPSIQRLGDQSMLIRTMSLLALLMNVLWVIPWVLLVWDAFGNYSLETRDTIWRLLWTAADIAIFCTLATSELIRNRWADRQKKFFQSLPLVCMIYAAFDVFLLIWIPYPYNEIVEKFVLAECILLVLQAVIIYILQQDQLRKQKQEKIKQEFAEQRERQAQAREIEAEKDTAAQREEKDELQDQADFGKE